MIIRLIHYVYPDLKKDELKKIGLLALAFMIVVGTYWLMRLLKDVLLYKIAFPASLGWAEDTGRLWIPTIKTVSLVFVFLLVLLYSKLVDMYEKHVLIYIVSSFYMIVFSVMSIILLIKDIYGDAALGWPLLASASILGYLFTESFGSLAIALFWSFTISSTSAEQAKRSFPFIVAAGQFGAVIGSALILITTTHTWPLYALIVIFLGLLAGIIYYLCKTIPAVELTSGTVEHKKKSDIWSGFTLLGTKPYLVGVLLISTLYEIASTIIEYQMDSQASVLFNESSFKWFKGMYGISINVLACLIAIIGTSYIIKRFGTRICLLIYPTSFAIVLIGLYIYYRQMPSPTALLWATFIAIVIIKASCYAINNPVKEMMYIPTSKDVKFKTKSIIDMFGSRSAKMSGAQISQYLNVENNIALSIHNLMLYGTLISLGVIGIWIIAAFYVGKKNVELVRNKQIIE